MLKNALTFRNCWANKSSVLHREEHLISVSIHGFPGRVLEYCWPHEPGQLKYNMRKGLLCWLQCKPLSKQYLHRCCIWINTVLDQQHTEHFLWSSRASKIWKNFKFLKGDNNGHGRGRGAYVLGLGEKTVWSPFVSLGEGYSWCLC